MAACYLLLADHRCVLAAIKRYSVLCLRDATTAQVAKAKSHFEGHKDKEDDDKDLSFNFDDENNNNPDQLF